MDKNSKRKQVQEALQLFYTTSCREVKGRETKAGRQVERSFREVFRQRDKNRGMILGGEMIEMIIEGALEAMPSTLHHSDTLCQRGRD
jgi:hypothetical protein